MGLEVLYLLIPASILLAFVALALFLWAIHNGQFDDLQTPAIRILFDEDDAGDAPRGADAEARAEAPEHGHAGAAPPPVRSNPSAKDA